MRPRQVAFILARAALRATGSGPPDTVFIMGHMRCGSTLLLHVLLTNPEFTGCGERNTPYRAASDLDKLAIASRISQRSLFRRIRYAVDQINHDHLTPNPEILWDKRVRCIFLLRDPRSTIQSIVHLTKAFYEPWSVTRAVDYYSLRLESLAQYAAELYRRRELLALTYDELITETPVTLRRMESFLGLETSLQEQYALQRFTGIRGDPTERIRTGHILRHRVERFCEIPDFELGRARSAYRACIEALDRAG